MIILDVPFPDSSNSLYLNITPTIYDEVKRIIGDDSLKKWRIRIVKTVLDTYEVDNTVVRFAGFFDLSRSTDYYDYCEPLRVGCDSYYKTIYIKYDLDCNDITYKV